MFGENYYLKLVQHYEQINKEINLSCLPLLPKFLLQWTDSYLKLSLNPLPYSLTFESDGQEFQLGPPYWINYPHRMNYISLKYFIWSLSRMDL